MDVSGNYTFDAQQELVWNALQDPNVLGSVMPGGKAFEKIADNQFTGVLEIRVGPVQGTFQGQIKLNDVMPPTSYQIEVDGKGAPGFVKATGAIKLEARDAQTYMDYSGSAQIGGKIASVGQRLLDTSARSIIRQSLDGLNEYLKVQVAQKAQETALAQAQQQATASSTSTVSAAAVAIPAYKPPSEAQLAFNLARDVFNDYVPTAYRPVVIGGVVIVVLFILWRIFVR